MTCCTPQNRPADAKDTPAATVEDDTETRDMAAFAQKCQEMFSQGMPDCFAQMREQTHTAPSED